MSGRRRALLAMVAVFAAAVGLGAYVAHALRQPELASVDARFTFRGARTAPSDVVLVKVDDVTFSELHVRWPFPRTLHARVIDQLHRAGARAIGYDVQFTEPTRPKDDNALLDAVAGAPGVVLATTEVGRGGRTNVFGGDDVVRDVRARAANANLPADADGALRRIPRSVDGLETFAVAVAERAKRGRVAASFPSGGAPIDYAGPPGTIRSISFSRVLRGHFPASAVRGKTVIVGPTAPSLQDVHATSASRSDLMPGAEIQANAVSSVMRGNPLGGSSTWLDVLLILVFAVGAPLASLKLAPARALVAGVVIAALYVLAAQIAFNSGLIVPLTYPLLAASVALVGALAVNYVVASFERERVRDTFARFVPESVVDQALARADGNLRLGGVQREVTVLFSDIRGFTTFSEARPPDEVIEVLNHYLSAMSAAIMDHGGTLVSYIGDGIMAVFGAPIEQPDHAERALAAAREMLGERLDGVNEWLAGIGESPFRMGVGLNSGMVMAGNVGSDRRLEYTAIGDTVNTASRLESMTKGSGYELFLSDQTVMKLAHRDDDIVFVGDLEVRGRSGTLGVWASAALAPAEPPREIAPISSPRHPGLSR